MSKITISVTPELYNKMRQYGNFFNWSEVFRNAVRKIFEERENCPYCMEKETFPMDLDALGIQKKCQHRFHLEYLRKTKQKKT